MVAVSTKHVTLRKDRNAALHIAHEFRGETLHWNRKPFPLASNVGTPRFRFLNDLGLQEVERLLERSRWSIAKQFRKEVHAVPNTCLIHRGDVVPVAQPY